MFRKFSQILKKEVNVDKWPIEWIKVKYMHLLSQTSYDVNNQRNSSFLNCVHKQVYSYYYKKKVFSSLRSESKI